MAVGGAHELAVPKQRVEDLAQEGSLQRPFFLLEEGAGGRALRPVTGDLALRLGRLKGLGAQGFREQSPVEQGLEVVRGCHRCPLAVVPPAL